MSFPTKSERQACWDARDHYWKCLDTHPDSKPDTKEPKECSKLRQLFETSCPGQWVKHFDRKYSYLQYKERIEKHGYEPLNEKLK